jgi:soluble lytic murein transglycosylase-like protein
MSSLLRVFTFVMALGLYASSASAQYDSYIREASDLYQIPEAFIRAVIRVESNFDPDCRSHVGAMGLMQLMPETARNMGVTDAYDPYQNIMGGTRFLRILANQYGGDIALVLAAYNAGAGRVALYLSRRRDLPVITVTRYIPRVLRYYDEYRSST